MPGKYFCSLESPNFAVFTHSRRLFRNFGYTANFLTRLLGKISIKMHTWAYINFVEYLHPKGTFLFRNFCNTLKKFYEKKNQILCLLGADTETIYMELQTPAIRLKHTPI